MTYIFIPVLSYTLAKVASDDLVNDQMTYDYAAHQNRINGLKYSKGNQK